MLDCSNYDSCVNNKIITEDIKTPYFRFISVGCWGVYCDTGEITIAKFKKEKFKSENIVRGQKEVSEALINFTKEHKVTDMYLAGDNVYQLGIQSTDKEVNNFLEEKRELVKKLSGKELDPLKNFDMKKQISLGFENCFKKANIDRFFMAIGNHDIENCEVLNIQKNYSGWNFPSLYYNVLYKCDGFTVNIIVLDTNMFEDTAETCLKIPFTEKQIIDQKDWARSVSKLGDWNIVIGHIPYHANGHKETNHHVRRIELEKLIKEMRPNLYICADEHNQQFINEDIPIVVAGSGGTELDNVFDKDKWVDNTEHFVSDYGFVVYYVEKDNLELSFISTKNIQLFTKKIKRS